MIQLLFFPLKNDSLGYNNLILLKFVILFENVKPMNDKKFSVAFQMSFCFSIINYPFKRSLHPCEAREIKKMRSFHVCSRASVHSEFVQINFLQT